MDKKKPSVFALGFLFTWQRPSKTDGVEVVVNHSRFVFASLLPSRCGG